MRTVELTALFAAVVALGFIISSQGRAHDPYSGWKQPGTGKSCCDDRDCRPVRSYLGDDGLHYVFFLSRWRPVPPDRVLLIPPPDGRSHACIDNESLEIHCFVNGAPRS